MNDNSKNTPHGSIISPKSAAWIFCGSAIVAFGLYQVHALSVVTEGGALGLNLLLEYWFAISPAVTNFLFNIVSYLLGLKTLGSGFLLRSGMAAVSFSLCYRFFEQFPRLWPGLYELPLLAAVLGALFVGVGTGICVRQNAAVCGDDALAMSLSQITGLCIQWVYLISDLTVLLLSASYIPLHRLGYSLLTVFLSGQIIGLFQEKMVKPH